LAEGSDPRATTKHSAAQAKFVLRAFTQNKTMKVGRAVAKGGQTRAK
jgi:hypothetical protein